MDSLLIFILLCILILLVGIFVVILTGGSVGERRLQQDQITNEHLARLIKLLECRFGPPF